MIVFALLLLVLIALFIFLVLGMIKPKRVLKWDKNPNRLKVFLYWITISFFTFAILSLIGVFTSEEFQEKKALEKIAEEKKKIERKEESKKIDAITYAQECVKQRLKAPATAEFSLLNTEVNKINDSIYLVRGTVDAQNTFGALLRSHYKCKLIITNDEHFICSEVILKDQ